jgi:hypothetical protein
MGKRLTNSLVGGGHEGRSGSNEESEEEKGTHLDYKDLRRDG